MTVKDATVRFTDGTGVRTRGETLLDPDEGVYIVYGDEPGTKIVFNWNNLTYIAESVADDQPVTPRANSGEANNGMFL